MYSTRIDPVTGRPEYDQERKPGHQQARHLLPVALGAARTGRRPPTAPRRGTSTSRPTRTSARAWSAWRWTTCRGAASPGRRRRSSWWTDAGHIGEIQAWNLATGERVWTHEFADSQNWGPILTTGGGLVFAGGTNDRYFRAFDAETGEVLWEQRTNSGVIGVPSSYEIDGVQYIAVQSGWGVDAAGMQRAVNAHFDAEKLVPQGGVIWVFALPAEAR